MASQREPPQATFQTNTELLLGLQDARNNAIWQMFVARYRTPLVAFAQRLGLDRDAAEDAAQEALMSFLRAYREGRYERELGRLRSWLFGIAVNAIRRQRRLARKEHLVADDGRGTAFVNKIPDEQSWSEIWEREWRQAVLKACLDEMRKSTEPHTMEAFELYVLKEWPADKVAERVGISRDAVFQGKRRLMAKMRETLKGMEEEW